MRTAAATRSTRRSFLRTLGAGAVGVSAAGVGGTLAGCSGSGGVQVELQMSSWNIPVDLETYRTFAAEYAEQHPSVSIEVLVTTGDFNQWMTTRSAASMAPDIVRITPQQIGRFAANGTLVDITRYLPADIEDDYRQTYWSIGERGGHVYGLMQHTDTMVPYYRTDIFEEIGVRPPTRLEDAWTWTEFIEIARECKKATKSYGFTYGFEGPDTAYRWLPILYMHGGRLLEDDGKTPAIESVAGIDALEWTQRWYTEGLVSASNTAKSSDGTAIHANFVGGQAAMLIQHPGPIANVRAGLDDEQWDTTYMFRDESRAADLGGNLLAVTSSSEHPEIAADFVAYVNSRANARRFCQAGGWLPVRKSLRAKDIGYDYRPEVMQRYIDQGTTVPADMAAVEAGEFFNSINIVLADYLDLCSIGSMAPKEAARAISEGIRSVAV